MTASPTPLSCLVAFVSAGLISVGIGCGGAADRTTHRIPEYDVAVDLPASWDAVDNRTSEEELDDFQRDHPRYLGVADTFSDPSRKLLAAAEGGDVRLLLSIDDVPAAYTLTRHMEENLSGFGSFAPERDVRIHGPREEIVQVAGGPAWKLRWSYKGDLGRIQLLQYTLVRDGQLYLITYSTLKPWAASSAAFEDSAESIRIGSSEADGSSADEPSASTGLIAFYRERHEEKSDLYVVSAEGGKERRLTRTGTDFTPAWSPDGRLIAFTSGRDGNDEIYAMRADGSGQRRLTTSPEPDSSPSWSPDGKRIMFTRGSSGGDASDLYGMNADGSGVERLTRDGESADGSWSPDGEQIVFWSGRDHGSGVFVMNADGSDVRPLTAEFEVAWGADWSPDGRSILFVGSRDDGDDIPSIWRMDAGGSDQQKLASPTGYWIDEPEWSPDGESIAFFSDGLGPGAIWVMNADGTQQRAVTKIGDSHSPSWRP